MSRRKASKAKNNMPVKSKVRKRTRARILEILKCEGPSEAAELARVVKVSAMAVRQHLYEMNEQSLVTFEEKSGRLGRPAKQWRLTAEADQYFPDAHQDLALNLVEGIRKTFGQEGIEKLLKVRAEGQIKEYKERVKNKGTLRGKLQELAEVRTEEGYMAAVCKVGESDFLLVENHCPICSAARSCTGLCQAELNVFQTVLGENAVVERTEHILSGARRCAYRVSQRK